MARDWWDKSWNPVVGCSKVSNECRHCWAEGMARRLKAMGRPEYQWVIGHGPAGEGKWSGGISTVPKRLGDPLRFRTPRVIAVTLMGDLFHPNVPQDYLMDVFNVMALAKQHRFILLTKRADEMLGTVNRLELLSETFPHVWMGVTAGNQEGADARRDSLWALSRMGWNTWVSSEPRISPIDWSGWEFLKFGATGGESGPYARIMDPVWPRADREWFKANGIPWMFKQWGEWCPLDHLNWVTDATTFHWCPVEVTSGAWMVRVGKHLAGHVLDGEEWRELPWSVLAPGDRESGGR